MTPTISGDPIPCAGCGYAVCSCPEDLDGWTHGGDNGRIFFKHASGALVWHDVADQGRWHWGYDPDGGAVHCPREFAKASKEEAMTSALALYARLELGI